MRRVLLPMMLVLAAGCSDQGPEATLRREIQQNRALWDAHRPETYTYNVQVLCFCPMTPLGGVVVRVSGTQVLGRTYAETGDAVDPVGADSYPSVDGLFQILEDAVNRDAAHISVTWDPDTGVPLDFFIDYQEQVADEELGYRVLAVPSPA